MKLHKYMPANERFDVRVIKGEKCWTWTGAKDNKGYGVLMVDGKMTRAHRYAYQAMKQPIPDGLHVLHACDNPSCVNPVHLWLGTNAENVEDRVKKGRNHDRSGEKNPRAKLSYEKADEIRMLRERGVKVKDICERFGIGRLQVWRVTSNKLWLRSKKQSTSPKDTKSKKTKTSKKHLPSTQ